MEKQERHLISLIVPAFNEQDNLPLLYTRICAVDWNSRGCDIEIIVIDDHSTDDSSLVLQKLAKEDSRVKWIRFSKNFGSHQAFAAGVEICSGNAAVLLSADLQDPPEFVLELIEKWFNGYKVVWAVREHRRQESIITQLFSRMYYWLMNRLACMEMPPRGADFLLIDKMIIRLLRLHPEKNTSIIALIQWMGFSQVWIPYTKMPRKSGRSKWTFVKKLKLAIDSFISFSYFPIRFMSVMGIGLSTLGIIYAAFLIVRRIITVCPIEGWTSLICVVLILSGVQLLTLGVLGEYLWRAFDETRRRPRYIIEGSSEGVIQQEPQSQTQL